MIFSLNFYSNKNIILNLSKWNHEEKKNKKSGIM